MLAEEKVEFRYIEKLKERMDLLWLVGLSISSAFLPTFPHPSATTTCVCTTSFGYVTCKHTDFGTYSFQLPSLSGTKANKL